MRILTREMMVKEEELLPYQMLFDIVLLPEFCEDKERVNKRGKQLRDKINNKLKGKNSWVGNFMPLSRFELYAFFVVVCSSGSRTKIKNIITKSTEDEDLLVFR